MFQGNRYVTNGVVNSIPMEVQQFLWGLIDNLATRQEVRIDYLQVFELSQSPNGGQQIVHKQEMPAYYASYQFDNVEKTINAKIYAIDDGDYCTLLLPSER